MLRSLNVLFYSYISACREKKNMFLWWVSTLICTQMMDPHPISKAETIYTVVDDHFNLLFLRPGSSGHHLYLIITGYVTEVTGSEGKPRHFFLHRKISQLLLRDSKIFPGHGNDIYSLSGKPDSSGTSSYNLKKKKKRSGGFLFIVLLRFEVHQLTLSCVDEQWI